MYCCRFPWKCKFWEEGAAFFLQSISRAWDMIGSVYLLNDDGTNDFQFGWWYLWTLGLHILALLFLSLSLFFPSSFFFFFLHFIHLLYSLLGRGQDCFNGKTESRHGLKIGIFFPFRLNSPGLFNILDKVPYLFFFDTMPNKACGTEESVP